MTGFKTRKSDGRVFPTSSGVDKVSTTPVVVENVVRGSRKRVRRLLNVLDESGEIVAERKFLKRLEDAEQSGVVSVNSDIGEVNVKNEIVFTKRRIGMLKMESSRADEKKMAEIRGAEKSFSKEFITGKVTHKPALMSDGTLKLVKKRRR